MTEKLIAIGLDSLDPPLCEQWLEAGHLRNLAELRERGAWAPLDTTGSENAWTTFLTGMMPEQTGFWSHYSFDSDHYRCGLPGTYDFEEFPPFYALGEGYRVGVIDMPQVRLSDAVSGVQVLSYGAHAPFTPRVSQPADVLPKLIKRYGDHPKSDGKDFARFWRRSSLNGLVRGLKVGAERRGAMCCDMLREDQWDLFLAVFGEIHSVCHYLWHAAKEDHPIYEHFKDKFDHDPMLEVAETVDAMLGRIIEAAPKDARFLVFSQEGMVPNYGDVQGSLFLPEMLYRYSFPGRRGIEPDPSARVGENAPPPPPILRPMSKAWFREAWSMKHDDNRLRRFLRRNLPIELGWLVEKVMGTPGGPGHPWDFDIKYQPSIWYSPYWPEMKAFALPTASQQGKIRINLRGREPEGVVAPEDYDTLCNEITEHLLALRNARTGGRLVEKVTRIRDSAEDRDPKKFFADLEVYWVPEPTDVIDSPTFGRFGPVQYMRTGGHVERGFALFAGDGIQRGARLAEGHVVDLPPTILEMIGAPVPGYMVGHSLLSGQSFHAPSDGRSESSLTA